MLAPCRRALCVLAPPRESARGWPSARRSRSRAGTGVAPASSAPRRRGRAGVGRRDLDRVQRRAMGAASVPRRTCHRSGRRRRRSRAQRLLRSPGALRPAAEPRDAHARARRDLRLRPRGLASCRREAPPVGRGRDRGRCRVARDAPRRSDDCDWGARTGSGALDPSRSPRAARPRASRRRRGRHAHRLRSRLDLVGHPDRPRGRFELAGVGPPGIGGARDGGEVRMELELRRRPFPRNQDCRPHHRRADPGRVLASIHARSLQQRSLVRGSRTHGYVWMELPRSCSATG